MKQTVRTVAEAQAIIQTIAPADYKTYSLFSAGDKDIDKYLKHALKTNDEVSIWYSDKENDADNEYCIYTDGYGKAGVKVRTWSASKNNYIVVAEIEIDYNAENTVEVEEYAVSVEAQEVATQAEIDNAKAQEEKLNPFSKYGSWYSGWKSKAASAAGEDYRNGDRKNLIVTKAESARYFPRVQSESMCADNALVINCEGFNEKRRDAEALVVFYFNPQGKPAAFVKTLKTDTHTQIGRGGRYDSYEVNERLVFNKYAKADRLEYALAVFNLTIEQLVELHSKLKTDEQATLTYNKKSKTYKIVEVEVIAEDDGSNDDAEEDFLATLDTLIDEDSETDELVDEAEPVQEKIYTANWTLGYDNPRSDSKEFKTAVEVNGVEGVDDDLILAQLETDAELSALETEVRQYHKIIKDANSEIYLIQNGYNEGNVESVQAKLDTAQAALFKLNKEQFNALNVVDVKIIIDDGERHIKNHPAAYGIERDKKSLQDAKHLLAGLYKVYLKHKADVLLQMDLQSANSYYDPALEPVSEEEPAEEKIFVAYVLRFDGWSYHRKGKKFFNNATDAFNYLDKKKYKNDNWELVIEVWDSEADYYEYSGYSSFEEEHKIYTNSPVFDEYTTNAEIQKLIEERDAKAAADKIAEEKALAEEKARKEKLEQAEKTCRTLYDDWAAQKKKLADLRHYRGQCKDAAKKAAYDLKIAELEKAFKPLDEKYNAAWDICIHSKANDFEVEI